MLKHLIVMGRFRYFLRLVFGVLCGAFLGFASINPSWAGDYDDYFRAIHSDDVRTLDVFLKRGMDPNVRNSEGVPGLIVAIRAHAVQVTQLLLAHRKIDIEARTLSDESALMMAGLLGHEEIAKRLIAKGALINKTGWTPLHYAATKGHIGIIGMLLEKSADIDARSPNQTTPLMMAAMYGTFDAVKFLMAEGADFLLTNEQKLSALDFAKQADRKDVMNLLTTAVGAATTKGSW